MNETEALFKAKEILKNATIAAEETAAVATATAAKVVERATLTAARVVEEAASTSYSQANSWHEYRMLILSELKALNDNILRLSDKIDFINTNLVSEVNKLDKRVVILETKAAFIGAFGGLVSFGFVELIKYLVGV